MYNRCGAYDDIQHSLMVVAAFYYYYTLCIADKKAKM